MEPQTNSGQYSNTALVGVGIAVAVLGGVVGGIAGAMFAPARESVPAENQQAYNTPTNMLLPTEDIRSISGTVTALSGNRMTVHTQGNADYPERVIFVNNDTKILKLSQKDASMATSVMKEYTKKEESKKTPHLVLPPDPFTRTDSEASEISVGDFVFVTSAQSIATKKEFLANEVQFSAPMSIGTSFKK